MVWRKKTILAHENLEESLDTSLAYDSSSTEWRTLGKEDSFSVVSNCVEKLLGKCSFASLFAKGVGKNGVENNAVEKPTYASLTIGS